MKGEERREMVDFFVLPEDCMAKVLSLTSPLDVCRLSLVSSTVRSAADSDVIWDTFLPKDYHDIVSQLVFSSKKELYFRLCNHPLLIDGGTKSFWLEKWSGKKCYMLAARDLNIAWDDTPFYWRWTRLPESRFTEVAELVNVCWLEIRGKIDTRLLSPDTTYAAYLVFKSTPETYGFEYQPVEGSVVISGCEGETRTVYLDPDGEQRHRFQIVPRRLGRFNYNFAANVDVDMDMEGGGRVWAARENSDHIQYPKGRRDGWMEIEFGELFNKSGEDGELEVIVQEVKSGNWKGGIILEGIEIRPKEGS